MSSLKNKLRLTKYQRTILDILVRKIESSKTYNGNNKVNQSFVCSPADAYGEYYSDYADIGAVDTVNTELAELKSLHLIDIEYRANEIRKVIGIFERYDDYCELLGKKGKREEADEYRTLLKRFIGKTRTLDNYCEKQLLYLENRRKVIGVQKLSELKNILRCINYIENNTEEIMERELSIELFSDSKTFENNYRGKVCTILKNYGDYADVVLEETDAKNINKAILSKNNVVSNPTYIYFKGDGELIFNDGERILLSKEHSFAISSRDLPDISKISVSMQYVMTVENLTSFNRSVSENAFLIYLSGYNNKAKSDFITSIANSNHISGWFHFGDIDPDGFYILENIRRSTGLDILPYRMGLTELEKYNKYTKSLEKQDIIKAQSLEGKQKYAGIMRYLINNNCKLEQEIISWKRPLLTI